MTLGADFSPDNGRGQFLGIWRFMADAAAIPILPPLALDTGHDGDHGSNDHQHEGEQRHQEKSVRATHARPFGT